MKRWIIYLMSTANNLTKKFVWYLAVTLLLVIGATNYWLYRDTQSHLLQSLDQKADAKLVVLQSLSGYYISHFETQLLAGLGNNVQAEPGVAAITVYDGAGQTLYHGGDPQRANRQMYTRTVAYDGEKIGEIELAMDTTQLQRELTNALWRSVSMVVVAISLIGGILFFFFRTQVVTEVERTRREEAAMRERHDFFSAVIDTSDSLVMVLDPQGSIILANVRCANIMNSTPQGVTGKELWGYFDILCDGRSIKELLGTQDFLTYLHNVQRMQEHVCQSIHEDEHGEQTVIEWSFSHLPDEQGRVKYLIGAGADITLRHIEQQLLSQKAYYDSLTALPNRLLFQDRLNEAAKRSRRNKECFALLYVDLDHFKPINDTLGHEAGDFTLKLMAGRMSKCLREVDTVARIGGDEFAVILLDVQGRSNAGLVASKLIAQVSEVFEFKHHRLHVGASIGVALYPEQTDELERLIMYADHAMYLAKQGGRNQFQYYLPPSGTP